MADIATGMLDVFTGDAVKELLDLRPWMQGKTFELLTKPSEVEAYIDRLIEKGLCGLDLETTSLNTRKKKDNSVYAKIVGVCLAITPNEGAYIPVLHEDKEFNVPFKFMMQQLKRLVNNCVCVYHNFKFDGEVLRNHGIIIEDEDMYEDTYLLTAIEDASRKEKKLKWLSEHVLKRPMIEITELGVTGSKKKTVAFDMVPPQTAVYYGASDAMNTLGLYLVLKKRVDLQDPDGKQGPWYIYKIEKRALFVTMEMERNTVLIDKEYLLGTQAEVKNRMKGILKDVHNLAGREFDINSPKQLGAVLFDELKIRYPLKEKSASGQYKTDEKTLVLIEKEAPIVKKILSYRGYSKLLGTYIENFLGNVDEYNYAKFQLNQVRADTGRFSASGGRGVKIDGYCGVNCQNIPTYRKDDPDSIDMRRAVIARPGFKIVTIDYSGEELRIAANMSREPKWIKEFNHGTGDLHTITGQIIHGKEEISKEERGLGKTLNFHTIYGGGAGGFAMRAKLPVDTAKKMLFNFFKKYDVLARWLTDEAKRAKKRGYSKTAFGRRRPLKEFYNSNDRKIAARGDRCAINSAIQGSGADVIKIALYRVWKWIHSNGFTDDDIRILMPIHDEIVYEIREDKLGFFIENIAELMAIKEFTERLQWPVGFTVDAEYGDSLSITNDYFKEKAELEKQSRIEGKQILDVKKDNDMVSQPVSEKEESFNVRPSEPVKKEEPEEKKEENDPQADLSEKEQPESPQMMITQESSSLSQTGDQYINFTVTFAESDEEKESKPTKEEEVDEAALSNNDLKSRLDDKGFYVHEVKVLDHVASCHIKNIVDMLEEYDNFFVGTKCRLKLVAPDGTVLHKVYNKVSVDAFESLCLWHNI